MGWQGAKREVEESEVEVLGSLHLTLKVVSHIRSLWAMQAWWLWLLNTASQLTAEVLRWHAQCFVGSKQTADDVITNLHGLTWTRA